MTNIVAARLRKKTEKVTHNNADDLMRDAADEIDRLESLATVNLHSVTARQAGSTLQHLCYDTARSAGWWIDTETGEDVRTWPDKFFKLWVSAKLMLCVTELAEAMEGHRKGLRDTHLPTRTMLEVELADTVIRACDLAGGLALDLGGAIAEKLAYNAKRADHKIENRIAEGGKSI